MSQRFAVIGAGAIGLACAYYLRRAGCDVAVFEKRHIGAGSSHGNAGWIVPSLAAPLPSPGRISFALRSLVLPDSPFHLSVRTVPALAGWLIGFARRCNASDYLVGLRNLAEFSEPTMQLYDDLTLDGIDLEMSTKGLLFAFLSRAAAEDEIAALRPIRDYGYDIADEPLAYEVVHELAPVLSDAVKAGVFVQGERNFNPSRLLSELTKKLQHLGVEIHEETGVTDFIRVGTHVSALVTSGGPVEVSGVLLAAGAWTSTLGRKLGIALPIQAGKGYSFSLDIEPIPELPLYLGEAMIGCSAMDGYVRLAGTMDVSTVNDSRNMKRIQSMKRAASKYLRPAAWATTRDHWMGMRPLTPDGLPVMGRLDPLTNAYVASGHQMVGITLAPATGRAMAQLITGADVPSLQPFAPSRFT